MWPVRLEKGWESFHDSSLAEDLEVDKEKATSRLRSGFYIFLNTLLN